MGPIPCPPPHTHTHPRTGCEGIVFQKRLKSFRTSWGLIQELNSNKADRRQAVAVSTRMPCAQSGVSGIFPLLGPPSGALGRALPTEESAPEGHRRQKPPTHHSALGRASALRLECPRAQTWPPCPLGSLPHPPPHILPAAPASQPHAVFILPSLWPPANPSSTSTLTPSCSHLCSWPPRCSVSSHKHSVRNRQLWKF